VADDAARPARSVLALRYRMGKVTPAMLSLPKRSFAAMVRVPLHTPPCLRVAHTAAPTASALLNLSPARGVAQGFLEASGLTLGAPRAFVRRTPIIFPCSRTPLGGLDPLPYHLGGRSLAGLLGAMHLPGALLPIASQLFIFWQLLFSYLLLGELRSGGAWAHPPSLLSACFGAMQ
jgi:hypothetical protein